MPKIRLRYAQDMLKIFPKYAQYMSKICPVYMQSVHFVFCTVCPPWISPYNLSTLNQSSPYNLHILHPFHFSLQWAASPPISWLGISLASSSGQLQPPLCKASVQVYYSIRPHTACHLVIEWMESIQWPDRTLWYKENTANGQSQPLRWRCVTTSSTYYVPVSIDATWQQSCLFIVVLLWQTGSSLIKCQSYRIAPTE